MALRVKPLRVSENARYREDWDIGHDVTVGIPEVGVQVDRRIVAATVTLSRGAGEDITFELGMHNAQSVFRRLEERLRQLSIASNE